MQSHLEDAKAKGAKVLVGDSPPSMPAPYDKGYFHRPAVVVSLLPLLLLVAASQAEAVVWDRSLSREHTCAAVWCFILGGQGSQHCGRMSLLCRWTQTPACGYTGRRTFGPAMPVFRFKYDEEAVKLANDTEYGLAAYFFTKVR